MTGITPSNRLLTSIFLDFRHKYAVCKRECQMPLEMDGDTSVLVLVEAVGEGEPLCGCWLDR